MGVAFFHVGIYPAVMEYIGVLPAFFMIVVFFLFLPAEGEEG